MESLVGKGRRRNGEGAAKSSPGNDIRGATYEEKLKDAGLSTLRERRKRGDLIEAFKVIKGHNNVNRDEWFDLRSRDESRPTRSNTTIEDGQEIRKKDVIYEPRSQRDTRKNFYTVRVSKMWNDLPEKIKDANSVNAFKNMYDKWMQEQEENQV